MFFVSMLLARQNAIVRSLQGTVMVRLWAAIRIGDTRAVPRMDIVFYR